MAEFDSPFLVNLVAAFQVGVTWRLGQQRRAGRQVGRASTQPSAAPPARTSRPRCQLAHHAHAAAPLPHTRTHT